MNNNDNLLDDEYLHLKSGNSEAIINANQFMLLSFCSFGLYEIWWMYKSWRFFKEQEGLDIMPAARALFTYIFIWSLFDKIKESAHSVGYTEDFSSFGMGVGFFIVNMCYRLPDPFWMISSFSFLFLLPAFKAMNHYRLHLQEDAAYYQEGFSSRQIAVIILGIILWVLVLIGNASK